MKHMQLEEKNQHHPITGCGSITAHPPVILFNDRFFWFHPQTWLCLLIWTRMDVESGRERRQGFVWESLSTDRGFRA